MCFFNGIKVSRADHIKLKELEISLQDYTLAMMRPMVSGFDFGDWPVIRPVNGGQGAELVMMHWELIPFYFKTFRSWSFSAKGALIPRQERRIRQRIP